ncbi:hypothetical protein EIN_083100 [Entamoeba invadens IP1]|uniref:Isochorismatase-like domain-containing protein n=1 Tax=Entamoeba invadens TaxID=33085 RepID=S0AZX5_ENTIV|nr:hypothetical protein EIN_083100 [Entamoeba invadens IP1]ELP85198.1 hypothetical protein EIN_083100 [Entamoeba invadens IP1]BAN40818.1 hypothetical protein [Entamoeba invadens]BAN42070.1 hypothetical protein [Entamoeba invadens]BAN42313.1 hypothetical protein [Entamoeba invadens]|eukprot:XP_004184544.1 hypothetical protein EIN_083100 [Entamoeba invadens IP1]
MNNITKICVLVDWSQAFVDTDGSFYGGETEQEIDKACQLVDMCERVIYFTDVHSAYCSEFTTNGGVYPVHNLVDKDLRIIKTNASARLTKRIQEHVNKKNLRCGIVIPNNVIYQTENDALDIDDILKTFDNPQRIITPRDYNYEYIISCKHFFNGTGLQVLPRGNPEEEFTGATLYQFQFGAGENVEFYLTGVVTGICVLHTAAGLRQMFPKAKIVIVKDACHPLLGRQFGIVDETQSDMIMSALCTQINVLYRGIDKVTNL